MLSEVLDYIPGETINTQNSDSLIYLKLAVVLALSSGIAVGLSMLIGYCSRHVF